MLDLKIAKPCDQSWTAMKGDERVRHCQRCDHNVYNIAEMSEKEVEVLIRRTEGKFCARIYRRTDNRVMTRDCPRGVAVVRRRVALAVTAACAAVLYGVSFVRRQPTTFVEAKTKVQATKTIERIHPPREFTTGLAARPIEAEVGQAIVVEPDVRLGRIKVIPKRR